MVVSEINRGMSYFLKRVDSLSLSYKIENKTKRSNEKYRVMSDKDAKQQEERMIKRKL